MSAFQIPDVERFSFRVPGDNTEYSIPSMLDLPEDKFKAIASAGDLQSEDPSALHALMASLADDDDEPCRKALTGLTLGQKVALIKAYSEASSVEPGESSAS